MSTPIRRVVFKNFKGLRNFTFSVTNINLLVGANNAGKSTIISAFRILELGLRKARTRKPERIVTKDEVVSGYQIDLEDLDVSTENVHTDYQDVDSIIDFHTATGMSITLCFPRTGGCYMTANVERGFAGSPATFNRFFPISLVVVPVLGPLQHDEEFVTLRTVQRNLGTSRASGNFRSYWVYNRNKFQAFADIVAKSWPGMLLERPEHDEKHVQLFCIENRMTRELYWAGFGFQIWCQLVAYISQAEAGSLIVIDEPEVYLHPDVQRQILPLLDSLDVSVVFATHSTEIIAQAEPSEIVAIQKSDTAARRLKEYAEVQLVLEEIGSAQNLSLSRLARYKRVIFVEGQDLKLLRKLAKRCESDFGDMPSHASVIESGGFQSWKRIRDFLWGAKRLGLDLQVAALYDSDYFPIGDVELVKDELTKAGCLAHVFARKEIENYLLSVTAITKAAASRVSKGQIAPTIANVEELLDGCCSDQKEHVFTRRFARSIGSAPVGNDLATTMKEQRADFEGKRSNTEWKHSRVPGKDVLKSLRGKLQATFGVAPSNLAIADHLQRSDLPEELGLLFGELTRFIESTAARR